MILYIMYNADLSDVAEGSDKLSLGFIDNTIVAIEGDDFHDMTSKIRDIMTRPGGALEWSTNYNSNFKLSKLAVMHFSQKKKKHRHLKKLTRLPRLMLQLNSMPIQEVESYKYLSIHIDYELCWNTQAQTSVARATKYLLAYRRLMKQSTCYELTSNLLLIGRSLSYPISGR